MSWTLKNSAYVESMTYDLDNMETRKDHAGREYRPYLLTLSRRNGDWSADVCGYLVDDDTTATTEWLSSTLHTLDQVGGDLAPALAEMTGGTWSRLSDRVVLVETVRSYALTGMMTRAVPASSRYPSGLAYKPTHLRLYQPYPNDSAQSFVAHFDEAHSGARETIESATPLADIGGELGEVLAHVTDGAWK